MSAASEIVLVLVLALASVVGLLGCNSSTHALVDGGGRADAGGGGAGGGGGDGDDASPDPCAGICGGGCPACSAGQRCGSDADCITSHCSADASTCALGTVSFAAAVSYPTSYKPYVMLSADLDGDGDIDLAVANEEGSTIGVYRNVGSSSGMFVEVPAATPDGFPTGTYPTGGAIADFNRDGIPDVATANFHGNSVTVLLGSGTGDAFALGPPASYATAVGAETSNLAVGDLNGDGIPDVIATNPQTSSISVFLGTGDGTLQSARTIAIGSAGTSQPYSVAIADFDGDGIADAAVADNATATMFIELGNGDGTFHLASSQPDIGGIQSFIVLTRDMNRDGKPDLIVTNRSSDNLTVLLGRGDGTFQPALVSSTGSNTGPYSLAVADFDLDGIPDVATANFVSSTVTILLGRGDGTFGPPLDAGSAGSHTYGVTAGDFNGDGKPDLATANAASNDMTVKLSTAH